MLIDGSRRQKVWKRAKRANRGSGSYKPLQVNGASRVLLQDVTSFVISDTHYLHNVVGDSEIRKGEGMQLDQLIQGTFYSRKTNVRIHPFGLHVLTEAFQLRETAPIDLPTAEKGVRTVAGKPKSESKDKERKHKKHRDKGREKDKERKKHKHHNKDRSKDKDKEKKKDKIGHQNPGAEHAKKHHEKKRKHDGGEDLNDIQSNKKSKHKTSKIDEIGAIRVAG